MSVGSIVDKAGKLYAYTFTYENWLREWRVFDGRPWIGVASCTLSGTTMTLADIQLREDILRPRAFWARLLRRPPVRINYRGRGLGSALLAMVIDHARKSECRTITGIVAARDLATNPRLVEWYRRHGFIYAATAPGLNVSGSISLYLE